MKTIRGETDIETSIQEAGIETELTAVEPADRVAALNNSVGEGTTGVGMLSVKDADMSISSTSYNLQTSYNLPDITVSKRSLK